MWQSYQEVLKCNNLTSLQDDIDRQRHREPLLSETETNPEDSKPKDNKAAVKFGWIKGVLVSEVFVLR